MIYSQTEYQKAIDEIWKQADYIYHLLNTHNLWSIDGEYTFPDGITLYKTDPYVSHQ